MRGKAVKLARHAAAVVVFADDARGGKGCGKRFLLEDRIG
jgi:hypothetical protein